VSKQELNLFQFSPSGMTPARATPAKIMGRKLLDTGSLCTLFDNVPDHILGYSLSPHRAVLPDRSKQQTFVESCCSCPNVNQVSLRSFARRSSDRCKMVDR
jgi:hypothetical protein